MIMPSLKGEYLTNHRCPATRKYLTTFPLNINPLPSYPADILEQWNCYLVLFNNHINPAILKHG